MKRLCLILFPCLLLTACLTRGGTPPSAQAPVPQRLVLNLTAEPATSIAVTWASSLELAGSCVEYAVATDGTSFEASPQNVPARLELCAEGEGAPRFHYSAILAGLKPGTRYCYRVGAGKTFSEWNQFSTATSDTQPFSFVWFGDPQDKLTEHCSRVFREAFRQAPSASFWLFTGDVCGDPVDWQWDQFFDAAGFSLRMIPSVLAPGNHDLAYQIPTGKFDPAGVVYGKRNTSKVGAVWRAHLTLPENGLKGLEETSYHLDFQGLRIIMINSNTQLAEQAAWLESLLANNPCRWTVVAFHHPLYNGGAKRDNKDTRNAFLPLFDKYKVDLVLTGHDHVYMRSHPLRSSQPVLPGEKGTLYLVSSSGPKFYDLNTPYEQLMAKVSSGKQLFQVFDVSADKLTLRTFTAQGYVFDTCVIEH